MSEPVPEEPQPTGREPTFKRRDASVILEVACPRFYAAPDEGWLDGPLPLPVPDATGTTVSDEGWRRRQLTPRAHSALHAKGFRFHRILPGTADCRIPRTQLTIESAELLRLWRRCSDRASGLLIVHLSAAGNGMRLLADLKIATRQLTTLEGTDVRGFYDELLLGGLGTVCEERNATLLAFVTEEAPTLNPSTDDGWTEDDQWLWGLASASPFGRSGYRRLADSRRAHRAASASRPRHPPRGGDAR